MAIDDYTKNIKALHDKGEADLKLSPETRDEYLRVIKDFRAALQAERTNMNGLELLGNVGGYRSANQTKSNLELNVTGLGGIEDTINKYLTYLDEFESTVKKAADRLLKHG
jgi:hypothetical protein